MTTKVELLGLSPVGEQLPRPQDLIAHVGASGVNFYKTQEVIAGIIDLGNASFIADSGLVQRCSQYPAVAVRIQRGDLGDGDSITVNVSTNNGSFHGESPSIHPNNHFRLSVFSSSELESLLQEYGVVLTSSGNLPADAPAALLELIAARAQIVINNIEEEEYQVSGFGGDMSVADLPESSDGEYVAFGLVEINDTPYQELIDGCVGVGRTSLTGTLSLTGHRTVTATTTSTTTTMPPETTTTTSTPPTSTTIPPTVETTTTTVPSTTTSIEIVPPPETLPPTGASTSEIAVPVGIGSFLIAAGLSMLAGRRLRNRSKSLDSF